MDQCEDREEGVPPSKSTLCGEHESQTKAQRNQPGPPPSCVSLQSNQSADRPINFKVYAAERGTKRKREPGPSCVSCKSNQSADRPINFKVYAAERGTKLKHEPGPSCVSLKSDWSADRPINLKVGPLSAAERLTEVHKKMMMEEDEDRAEFAGSSFPSMRSDLSQGRPPAFSAEPGLTRGQRSQSAGSSCPSVRSDRSRDEPPYYNAEPRATRVDQQSSEVPSGQSAQQHQTQLDSIFMLLEKNIITFVKNELKKIQKVLSPDYPECLESQRSSSRKAFVKITLDFLRRMKQEELADRLQRRAALRFRPQHHPVTADRSSNMLTAK